MSAHKEVKGQNRKMYCHFKTFLHRTKDINSLHNLNILLKNISNATSLNKLTSLFGKHILITFLHSETAKNIYRTVGKSQKILLNRHGYTYEDV